MATLSIYGDADPRDMPAYSIAEAAYWLVLPRATLRAWVMGHRYTDGAGLIHGARPLIYPSEREPVTLSFWNVVEASVLKVIRREHGLTMQSIRQALDFVKKKLEVQRPLLEQEFETDGVDLFVKHFERTVNVFRGGQIVMRDLIRASLRRVERAPSDNKPCAFLPWARNPEEPRSVRMSPLVAFGRPVLDGTGIPVDAVTDRYRAGDSCADLADDFGLDVTLVEDAMRWALNASSRPHAE